MSQLVRNNLLKFQKADVAFHMQQVVTDCTSVGTVWSRRDAEDALWGFVLMDDNFVVWMWYAVH